jgi:hypothetical protein
LIAVAVTSFTVPRLPRGARVALLTVHVVMSVGWVGIDGALVALEITGLSTGNPTVRAGIATAMAVIALWVLVPVVFFSVVTGLVLALSTPWGLVRHWWVLTKCGIAVVLTVAGLSVLLPQMQQILAGGGASIGRPTLVARSMALMLLLVATGLSVAKPWGKTPHGRRMQRTGKRPK